MEPITPLRLKLLRLVAEKPGVTRDILLSLPALAAADVDYLLRTDLIRESGSGGYRISHLGQLALKRPF